MRHYQEHVFVMKLTKVKQGQTVDNVPNYLMSLFRPSVQPYMISWLKYDPQKEIAQLNKPILLVQGETDLQVTVEDVNKLAKANCLTYQFDNGVGFNYVLSYGL